MVDLNVEKSDENVSIGDDTWVCISALEEEMDTAPFFSCVKAFYLATLQKMLKIPVQ